MYKEISEGRENFDITYTSTVFSQLEGREDYTGELAQEYYDCLRKNVEDDLRAGFTQKGVHRDDILAKINGKPVREYASQGQHRSAALIMKLSQAYILAEEIGDFPCILLDDVLSELDPARQKFVISKIHGMQVFITCCDMNIPFDEKSHGKIFYIKNGRISNDKSAV
jgi:DNA replication and repair protein RecF